jgi:hypothetical protein
VLPAFCRRSAGVLPAAPETAGWARVGTEPWAQPDPVEASSTSLLAGSPGLASRRGRRPGPARSGEVAGDQPGCLCAFMASRRGRGPFWAPQPTQTPWTRRDFAAGRGPDPVGAGHAPSRAATAKPADRHDPVGDERCRPSPMASTCDFVFRRSGSSRVPPVSTRSPRVLHVACTGGRVQWTRQGTPGQGPSTNAGPRERIGPALLPLPGPIRMLCQAVATRCGLRQALGPGCRP